jgi:signal transduction histidine kinase/integral membrane sensor domain MASE1
LYATLALAFALSLKVEGPAPLHFEAAVTVAALLLMPRRLWWPYFLLIVTLTLAYFGLLGLTPSFVVVVVILAGFVVVFVVSVLTVSLLRRFAAGPLHFDTVAQVASLLASAAVAAVPVALIATALRTVVFSWDFWTSWQVAYLGHVLGIVVFTPALVLWVTGGPGGLGLTSPRRQAELVLLGLATVLVGGLVFATHITDVTIAYTLIYLLVPLLIWAAIRFGPQGLASVLTLTTALAITGAVNDRGPFVGASATDNTLALQLFLLFVGVPLYFLAALVQERQAARAETQRQVEQLDRIIEQMADGVIVYDAQGHVVRANSAQQRLEGLDGAPAPSAALPLSERMALFAARDAQGRMLTSDEGPVPRALRGEGESGTEPIDLWSRTLDGREVALSVSAAPLRDKIGQVTGAVAVFRDQTERQQLERERAEQAEQLNRIFEGIVDGLVVYNADGYIVRENAAVRRLLGLDSAPPEYYLSSVFDRAHLYEVRDERGQLQPPGDWPQVRVLRGQGVSRVEELDGWVRTLDGRELYLHVTASPLRTREGRLVGAVTILHDQTERYRLERANAEQAAQLNRIFEGITDGVVVYDAEGNVARTNAAARRILGLDAAPSTYAQLPPVDRAVLFEAHDDQGHPLAADDWPLIRVLRGQVGPDGEGREVRLRMLDGREVDVYTSAAPLRDAAGRLLGAVTILHDQSERRRLEEARANELALRELNARLETFVAIAAHDLRAPVGVSRMVVERAQQVLRRAATTAEHDGHEPQARAAAQAAQAAETTGQNLGRLWRLVQQLLDVSRVREGTLVLDCQPVDLVELVRTGVEEQRLLTPTRVMMFDLPGALTPPITVQADPERLSQVISNYLSNAVRYSRESQPIVVTLQVVELATAETGRRMARVAVRDQGPGIAPEDQATIWDRFQRARSAMEVEGGLGLGLYIARTIVERHSGQVGVDSVVGSGSTFWFTLPTSPAAG